MKLEDKRIGPEIHRLDRKLSRYLAIHVKEAGLDEVTMMHGWIIRYLYQNREKDVYQKDIEKLFSVRRSTVTNLLQLMEKKGYVRRESVASDARLKKVLLTEKGIESQETAGKLIDHIEEELADGISEEELQVFYEVIRKITDNVEKYTGKDERKEEPDD
ncbi:MarR family winged helix-turn-helix transcriptional regulator [Faecalicatena contorta]|uniref:MarR family winged helix-turn-helix transcriptional regulator n=1 Tax=Faecalicatena contorta TaxID=39482 RepID=UPI001F26F5A8|nr:MarR family transcriptional regulator [Faecalicatena contorta]MCF2682488.1 MarR family transcriptional regulator [Faecalicatena contorta]